MSLLLSLPEELRDRVIEFVLFQERDPPSYTISAGKNRTKGTSFDSRQVRAWSYGPRHVRYDQSSTVANATGLLLTNTLLHRQTKEAIRRLFPDDVTYKLDVMFVDEQELWPTWLFVPYVTRQVHRIDVTFRVIGTNSGESGSAFTIGDGSPPQIVWCFYFLLEHFLYHGLTTPVPSKSSTSGGRKSRIKIRNVDLHFAFGDNYRLFPEDTHEQRDMWWSRQRQLQSQTLFDIDEVALLEAQQSRSLMHPIWLAKFVRSQVRGVLWMTYHTAEYGAMIHERVGSINFDLDEGMLSNVNAGDILAPMQATPDGSSGWYTASTFGHLPGECRLLTFWNWKYRTVQQRLSLGLSIPEQVTWPTLDQMTSLRSAIKIHREDRNDTNYKSYCDPKRCMCADRGLEEMLKGSRT